MHIYIWNKKGIGRSSDVFDSAAWEQTLLLISQTVFVARVSDSAVPVRYSASICRVHAGRSSLLGAPSLDPKEQSDSRHYSHSELRRSQSPRWIHSQRLATMSRYRPPRCRRTSLDRRTGVSSRFLGGSFWLACSHEKAYRIYRIIPHLFEKRV